MKSEMYKSKEFYIELLHSYLDQRISGKELVAKFNSQRRQDLENTMQDIEVPTSEVIELIESLASYGHLSLPLYVEVALKTPGFPKSFFFSKVMDIFHSNDLEDYWPRDDPYFEDSNNIDDEELRKRVKQTLQWITESEARPNGAYDLTPGVLDAYREANKYHEPRFSLITQQPQNH